jgi:hypothetical protein
MRAGGRLWLRHLGQHRREWSREAHAHSVPRLDHRRHGPRSKSPVRQTFHRVTPKPMNHRSHSPVSSRQSRCHWEAERPLSGRVHHFLGSDRQSMFPHIARSRSPAVRVAKQYIQPPLSQSRPNETPDSSYWASTTPGAKSGPARSLMDLISPAVWSSARIRSPCSRASSLK